MGVFDKPPVLTQEQIEDRVIGNKRSFFVQELDEIPKHLDKWAKNEMTDKEFGVWLARRCILLERITRIDT